MDEEWREIPNTDYSVSSEGRVASRKKGGWRVMKSRLRNGYPSMYICFSGGRQDIHVHRLVAEAFLGPPPTPKHQVNHKNGVKGDNRAENLEWVTSKENIRHRFDVLGQKAAHGAALPQCKLTETEVREIRALVVAGESQSVIAARYGVEQTNVSHIARGKTWNWLDPENGPLKFTRLVLRGEANGSSTLTETDVREIRGRYAAGEFQRVIGADYGVEQTTISSIVLGKTWRHLL